MSDDSHGISQVGTNYGRLLEFTVATHITSITFLEKGTTTDDPRFPGLAKDAVSVESMKGHSSFA